MVSSVPSNVNFLQLVTSSHYANRLPLYSPRKIAFTHRHSIPAGLILNERWEFLARFESNPSGGTSYLH